MENMRGSIFNIQKFSLNDGPGIRTVVFFKGCPLRCKWCSNPESQLSKVQMMWSQESCLYCHHCVEICPRHAIEFQDKQIRFDPKQCIGCGRCVKECPGNSLKNEGEQKTVDEIMEIVLQDLPFYEESGGGITLSGGEFLCQPQFAISLLNACKEKGIHTCCETTGYANSQIFENVIREIDYILFDVKHWDSKLHQKGTGVGNEQILANLNYAISTGKPVLPRIPVIPGFNDSLRDAKGISDCLKETGADTCQLLPFHQYGEKKYDQLGRAYTLRDVPAYHKEDLYDYQEVFQKEGIHAFF